MNRWQAVALYVLLCGLLAFLGTWITLQFAAAYESGLLHSIFGQQYVRYLR